MANAGDELHNRTSRSAALSNFVVRAELAEVDTPGEIQTEFIIRKLSGQIVGMWEEPERASVVGACLAAALHRPLDTLMVLGATQQRISLTGSDMVFGPMTVVFSGEVQVSGVVECLQYPLLHCRCPRVWVFDDVSGDIIQPFGVTPPFSGTLHADTLCGFEGWFVAELKTPGGIVLDPSWCIGCFGTVLYASRVRSEPVLLSLGESHEYNEDDLRDVVTPRSSRSV